MTTIGLATTELFSHRQLRRIVYLPVRHTHRLTKLDQAFHGHRLTFTTPRDQSDTDRPQYFMVSHLVFQPTSTDVLMPDITCEIEYESTSMTRLSLPHGIVSTIWPEICRSCLLNVRRRDQSLRECGQGVDSDVDTRYDNQYIRSCDVSLWLSHCRVWCSCSIVNKSYIVVVFVVIILVVVTITFVVIVVVVVILVVIVVFITFTLVVIIIV